MHHHQLTYSLVEEFETFRRELPNLLASEGKFVVVFGDKIIGTFVEFGDALAFGCDQCGLKPFLVKKIEAAELDRLCVELPQDSTGRPLSREFFEHP